MRADGTAVTSMEIAALARRRGARSKAPVVLVDGAVASAKSKRSRYSRTNTSSFSTIASS